MRASPGSSHRGERGFTLIELMISLVMFSVAMGGILAIAVTLSAGLREQRQTTTLQDSARSSMDYITEAIRTASAGAPTGNIQHVNTCAAGAFSVVDQTTGPDELTVVYPTGGITSSRSVYTTGTTALKLTDVSQISVGDTLMISDLSQGHLVSVTAVAPSSGVVTLAAQSCTSLSLPSGGYASGSLVLRMQRGRFYIDTIDGAPTLMLDPDAEGPATAEPLAEGIEDLQVAVGVDADSDGAITETGLAADDDEWAYNVAGDSAPAAAIRAARVTLVARTTKALPGHATFTRPTVENHAAATQADGYRRRVLSSIVEMRNIGGSP